MGWATGHIARLQDGETVQFRPRGHSMKGKVPDRALVTVRPFEPEELEVGSIVLCKVKGNQYLHLIKSIDSKGRYLIGNNRGGINGWIGLAQIYGLCVAVDP